MPNVDCVGECVCFGNCNSMSNKEIPLATCVCPQNCMIHSEETLCDGCGKTPCYSINASTRKVYCDECIRDAFIQIVTCNRCEHSIHTGVTCVMGSPGEYQGNDAFCGCGHSQ